MNIITTTAATVLMTPSRAATDVQAANRQNRAYDRESQKSMITAHGGQNPFGAQSLNRGTRTLTEAPSLFKQ